MSEIPAHFGVNCGVCGTRVTPPSKYAGRRVKCPDCETPIPIPTIEQYLARQRDQELMAPIQPEDQEPYAMQAAVERPAVRLTYTSEKSIIRRFKHRKPPKPPKWVFFSDVFNLPWQTKTTALRWCWLSGGLSFSGLLGALSAFIIQDAGFAGMIAALFFVMAQAWFSAWSFAYAASCSFSIIQDTASGLKIVEGWPDGGFRDWMFDFLTTLYVVFVSGFVAFVVASPLDLVFEPLLPQLAGTNAHLFLIHGLLFPVAFLGALDAPSIWLPFTGTVTRSLLRIPHCWLLFYVLLAVVWGIVFAAVFPLLIYMTWFGALVGGPILAGALFISARLLGRLAWQIGEDASRVDDDEDDDDDDE